VAVLGSLAYNPRLWLGDAPKAMQDALEPLSSREKRDRLLFAIPFFIVILGYPIWSVLNIEAAKDGLSFFEVFGHLWIIFIIVNLVDLVFLDWFFTVWWRPKFTYTNDMQPYLHHITYAYHFSTFLKGCTMMTVFTAIVAVIIVGLSLI
jgi:hypothetical protein